jgi:hypothetical protein
MKFPMMIYKNIYMKDMNYNIADDKIYLTQIIKDKQYAKFMDVYTLNRIIRMIITDDAQNSMLSEQVTEFLKKLVFKINRIIFCWTIMTISNLTCGILSFFLFIWSSDKPMRYLINTLFFTALSYYTNERLLMIILCEIFYPIIESKILIDVMDDTHQSLKRGIIGLYNRTRLESIALSIMLSYLSFIGLNNIGIYIIGCLNLIIMARIYLIDKLQFTSQIQINDIIQYPAKLLSQSMIISNTYRDQSKDQHVSKSYPASPGMRLQPPASPGVRLQPPISQIPKKTSIISFKPILRAITSILSPPAAATAATAAPAAAAQIAKSPMAMIDEIPVNRDILLIIHDNIKINLLLNVINPFIKIDRINILRTFTHLFLLLIFGYISKFYAHHILFLPIIIQNIVDLII